VRNRGGALAFGAKIVKTQSCLNRAVDNVLGLQCASLVKKIPLVVVFAAFAGRIEEKVVVEQVEEMEESVEGVLPAVAQQFWHFLVEELAQRLTSSTDWYI
jgi:hypothetical protein